MNNVAQLQQEQREIEQSPEYILDQLTLKLDERLALLRSKLDASREHDKEFDRYLAKIHRNVVLCEQCRKEAASR